MNKQKFFFVLGAIFIVLGAYASWHSFGRNQIIISNSVLPGYIPARIGQMHDIPCNQLATTTDCEKIATLPQTPPQPYVPPNTVVPLEEWTSTSNAPVTFFGFTFSLPPGWHGLVSDKGGSGQHLFVQKNPNEKGFTVDCPPDGKGLEAATRLSVEERIFVKNGASHTLSFEKWTAPGNDPWIFVILRREPSTSFPATSCLAQGSTDSDVATAMHMMYETWTQ